MWKRLLALTVVLALVAAGGAYLWAQRAITAPGPSTAATTVVIAKGSGVLEIAWQLKRAGVIEHPQLFRLLSDWRRLSGALKAGEYLFPAGASLQAALERIARGETEVHFITFAEGLTSSAILKILAAEQGLSGDLPVSVPEGTLLPATYDYQRGTERATILARMRTAMAAAVEAAWASRAPGLPLASKEELVTLASIVEKETGIPEERSQVAAVFFNRLSRNMRLQSDPTTIYAVTGGKAPLGRGLRRSELTAAHPYNTYQIAGLPPGPIANPGEAALMAVAHPAESDALYFVADGSGGHAFARTLAEHNRNVARWRALENTRKATE
ncbi:MAG: endolytic transglycosylase MltG [Alphaproteobacteria bacterium]|nr:endolytic transglycosylase MltG [Alphaproteobacteria bacterium]MCB9928641.1 endolytic transglycosylase MltG [Alphaproteobacteria bacterium]